MTTNEEQELGGGVTLGCVCHYRDEHPSGVFVPCDGRCGREPEAKRQVDLWVNGLSTHAIEQLRVEVAYAKERRGFALVDPWVLSRLIDDATRRT
jgi:hypothetical protein